MHKRLSQVSAGASALALLLLIGFGFAQKFRHRDDARAQVAGLMARLRLGDPQPRVLAVFGAGRTNALKLRSSPGASEWFVTTPTEWGANNWLLRLRFDAKKRLASVRLKTNDTPLLRPREPAPPDFSLPGF